MSYCGVAIFCCELCRCLVCIFVCCPLCCLLFATGLGLGFAAGFYEALEGGSIGFFQASVGLSVQFDAVFGFRVEGQFDGLLVLWMLFRVKGFTSLVLLYPNKNYFLCLWKLRRLGFVLTGYAT